VHRHTYWGAEVVVAGGWRGRRSSSKDSPRELRETGGLGRRPFAPGKQSRGGGLITWRANFLKCVDGNLRLGIRAVRVGRAVKPVYGRSSLQSVLCTKCPPSLGKIVRRREGPIAVLVMERLHRWLRCLLVGWAFMEITGRQEGAFQRRWLFGWPRSKGCQHPRVNPTELF